jgi:predicted alpha/beta-fold hydrolase
VTAPLHGFRNADHYWSEAASGPWLEHIRVPTLLLNALNDPFLPEHALLAAARKAAPCVVLEFPRTGGHAGFVSGPFPGHHRWLAERLLEFLEQ